MCAVSVAILVSVTLWNGLAPSCTALEVEMSSVGSSVNDVDINTFATISSVQVLVEGAEGKAVTVGKTSEAPWGTSLDFWNVLGVVAQCVYFLITLDVLDLWNGLVSVVLSLLPWAHVTPMMGGWESGMTRIRTSG